MPLNRAKAQNMPGMESSNPNTTGYSKIPRKSRKTSLEKRIPPSKPILRASAAVIVVSQNTILAICFFSMPKMLNRPNSFLRRFTKKLLV